MYAVAGVSGRTGAATAMALLKQGQKVRVLVRTEAQGEAWKARHAEVAVVDLTDSAGLANALKGTQGAFLLLPPNPAATDFLADRAAFLEKVIAGREEVGHQEHPLPLLHGRAAPGRARARWWRCTARRRRWRAWCPRSPSCGPGYFLENWSSSLMYALEKSELPHFGTVHVKFPQVGVHDVGVAAANALVENFHGTRHLELGGKENWSVEDVAVVLTSLLGQPIKPVSLPVESAKEVLEAGGMPAHMAGLYAELYQGLARGLLAFAHPHGFLRGNTPLFDALKTLV